MKTIICLSLCMMIFLYAYTQNLGDCVFCNSNTINKTVFASGIGTNNTATGSRSFVGGEGSFVTGDYAFSFGFRAIANGLSSIALGRNAEASGMYSVALGRGSKANDGAAFALGYMNIAQAESSYLFGEFLKSTAGGAFVIGMGAGSNYLLNNKPYSLMVGFNSIYPTLFVNSGAGVDKTGKVGIGNITAPTAKLHIKADDNEHASLKLEPTGTNKLALISLGNNGHVLSALANGDLEFKTQAGKGFFFENGKVITTGLQLSTGSGDGKMLQSDISGNATWTEPAWVVDNGNIYRLTGNVGIGTNMFSGHKLAVAGSVLVTGDLFVGESDIFVDGEIHAKKFKASIDPWPDYVFDPGYDLLSLFDVETFINTNRHLPGIPSSSVVAVEGVELGEITAALLQKVEELTLYLIAQQKEISELQERIEQFENR
jgi:hypothetical protein